MVHFYHSGARFAMKGDGFWRSATAILSGGACSVAFACRTPLIMAFLPPILSIVAAEEDHPRIVSILLLVRLQHPAVAD